MSLAELKVAIDAVPDPEVTQVSSVFPNLEWCWNKNIEDYRYELAGGLTKRDLFAAMAMQGMLANTVIGQLPHTEFSRTKRAVEHADALLAALEKPQ